MNDKSNLDEACEKWKAREQIAFSCMIMSCFGTLAGGFAVLVFKALELIFK